MPRPRRCRRVGRVPGVTYFKPAGVRMKELDEVILSVDEYEAVRLKDFEGFNQDEAASRMNISQPTFHRVLEEARKKIAEALVKGKAIKIHGGAYKMPGGDMTGPRGQGPMTGRGMGRGAGRGAGQGAGMGQGRGMGAGRGRGYGGPTNCKCPKCGKEVTHARGQPCVKQKCPECGSMMVGEILAKANI